MRFRLALRMRSLRSLTLDDLEPLVRIFGEFRVILQIGCGGGAKRLLLSDVQITLILLGVHQLWLYNQNTVGENGDFQPLYVKISRIIFYRAMRFDAKRDTALCIKVRRAVTKIIRDFLLIVSIVTVAVLPYRLQDIFTYRGRNTALLRSHVVCLSLRL